MLTYCLLAFVPPREHFTTLNFFTAKLKTTSLFVAVEAAETQQSPSHLHSFQQLLFLSSARQMTVTKMYFMHSWGATGSEGSSLDEFNPAAVMRSLI